MLRPRNQATRPAAHPVVRLVLALAVVGLSLVFVTAAPALAADPAITLFKAAPGEVLVGEDIAYSLTAGNPSTPDAVVEYNLTFRDVLPVGVTYRPGSTSPASFGEPVVLTDAGTGQQTLIWRNVADLTPGSSAELAFAAAVSDVANPAGATVVNDAGAYANSNPRFVPRFTGDGLPIPLSFTQSAADTVATVVTALRIRKSEPSPEAELLRGVHDHPTVYTLNVTNNDAAATDGVVVTDLLPAGLEFLGCGGVENSAAPEYPGAASLAATPPVGPDCLTPQSVSTVVDPAGQPAGTYTRVVWDLGDLAPGDVVTIRYAAGIPQRANTAAWPGAEPSPASLGQAANLDNNTGPATREPGAEQGLTNRARAEGDYTGPTAPGAETHVVANDSHVVTAEDIAVQKSVTPDGFNQGGVARFTFTVETSEYADASFVTLTDHLPNGLCPLDDVANHVAGAPADCAPGASFAPGGAEITGVVQNPDGSFDVSFSPFELDHDGVTQVSFSARMRTAYTGGPSAGDPTSANDEFADTVSLTATTVPVSGVNPPEPSGPVQVGDSSSATIGSGGPSIDKSILPNTTPMDCAVGAYVNDPTPAQNTFTEGSRVCFKLRVDFPDGVATRSPQVTDFLPIGVEYETGSAVLTAANNVAADFAATDGVPVWLLGAATPNGRFVQPGGVFEAIVSGIVVAPGAGPAPDVTANLMKFRYSRSDGSTAALRDSADINLAAPPPLSIRKGVAEVGGVPEGGNPADVDHVQVAAGDVVTFRVDLSNDGTPANGNAVDALSPDIWDVLPTGIGCADVSAISDGGACTDPGAGGHPSFTGNASRSAIRWQLPAAPALTPGATRTLTYDMVIPTAVSVSTVFTNTAAVRAFETGTNLGGPTAEHLPADNIDTTTGSADWDAPAASDDSDVFLPDVAVAKTNVTDITETNNGPGQAVVGETLTYTISARVPAHTSVYNGLLADPMPTGITFVSATAGFSGSNVAPATDPLPTGFSLSPTTGTLTFPASYANTTSSTQLFQVRIVARIATAPAATHGTVRTNTASFTSTTAETAGIPLPPRTATSPVTVVRPAPTLTKLDNDADNVVVAGQVISFTLRAANAAGRPPLHDAWVVDCVPGALAFNAFVTPHPGTATTTAGTGTNGCSAGTTRIAWHVPDVGATAQLLTYTVTVAGDAAGGASYTNTALLTGSTLNDGKADPLDPDNPLERVLTSATSATVTVAGAAVAKTATPTALTVGARGSWTVEVTLPANVNFYDAAVLDDLPEGISPASLTTDSVTCQLAGGAGPCPIPGGGAELTQTPGPGTHTTVGWLLGDMTSSPTARVVTITYSGVVADLSAVSRGANLTNAAHLGWALTNGTDPTSAGEPFDRSTTDGTATVRVLEPVLSVDKTVTDATPAPGDTISYSVAVSNLAGPDTSAAFNVEVADTVPAGVVVDPGTISNGGVLTGAGPNGGGTITWQLAGPIATGGSVTLGYDATLAPSATLTAGALTNTADITHFESLPNGGRGYDGPQDQAVVTPAFPHVSAAKSLAEPIAYIGEPKSWTVTVISDGTSTAYDVDATDTLPVSWTYAAGTSHVSVAGGPATAVEPVLGTSGAQQTLTWTDLGDLPVGATIVITYSSVPLPAVVTDPGVGSGVLHTNSAHPAADDATGAGGNADGPYAGPPASASARIDSADLAVDKSHTGSPVAGQSFTYSVLVSNLGADTARGPFQVVDTLPTGIGAAAASGPGWACSTSLVAVTCARTDAAATLASGASFPPISVTVGIPADTADGTTFANTASVADRTFDPDPSNNSDTDVATSTRSVDLALDKALSGAMVAGSDATYTLSVHNNGPSDSAGPIAVSDSVPTGTTFVSAEGPGWSCAEAAGVVTCTRAAGLAAGASAPQITLTVAVAEDRETSVVNTARVDGPEPDPVPGNNEDTVAATPDEVADLGIEKESPGEFVPGTQGTYRLTVHNFGPSDADAPVTITDPLPAELAYASFASVTGSWSCSATGQLVTCELAGRLAVDAEVVVDLTVDIDPGHVGPIVNQASVSSPTTDPDPVNDTDDDNTSSLVQTDLAIVKSHTGTAIAGTNLTYGLAVHNFGPSAASGPITVTDVLPAGMAFVSATGTGWTCDATGATVTCIRATSLGAGADAPDITVVVAVASGTGPATLTNIATVDGPDTDTDPGNNTDLDPTEVDDEANVSVLKSTTGADPVAAGGTTEFAIVVHNDGPSDADDVSVTDALPAGLSLVSVAGAGWSCNDASTVSCTRDTLSAGADAPPITVVVGVGSGVPAQTTITNTAVISTGTPGDDPDDNADDATVGVQTTADLRLVKSHPDGVVIAGTPITFDIAVTNLGPSDAQPDVVVVDDLPAGLTFVANDGPWACAAAGQQVTCTLDGGNALLAGADAPLLRITAQVAVSVDDGVLTNQATVSSPTTDPVPDNNTDTDEVTVGTEADLSVVKSHSDPVTVGAVLDFALLVTNSGPSEARAVSVTDALPTGLEYVAAAGTGWICGESGGTVGCDLTGPLAPGTSAAPITVSVRVLPEAYPGVSNTAVVSATTRDPDESDNASTDEVEVPALVDLAVAKSHDGDFQVGEEATYRISVTNNGPTADPGPVVVSDQLPDGLSFVSAEGPGWVCAHLSGTITCLDADGLAVAEQSSIDLTVQVGPAAYPSVVNVAEVSSAAEDTDPDNDVATDPAEVAPLVELVVEKELVAHTLTRATYRMTVTNNGPNVTVADVVVVDDLPPALSYVSAAGAGWTCGHVGQTVTCTYADPVAVGESVSFELVTAIDAEPGDTVTNFAIVLGGSSTGPDPEDDAVLVLPHEELLPDTGGPHRWLLLLGLAMLTTGAALIRRAAPRDRPSRPW